MRNSNRRRSHETRPFFLVALVSALLFGGAAADAQTVCGDRAEIVAALEEKYAEYPVGYGMTERGHVIELFVSESGSWTMMVSQPTGISCMIAVGESWNVVPPPVKPKGTAL